MSINSTLLSWKFFVAVFSSVILLGFLNYSLEIVPVSGLTFVITFVAVWFVSLFITLITFHKMLQKNKPIDLEFFKVANAKTPEKTFMLKPDSEAVKKLAEDIDKYFITKWYRYISVNNDFTAESKCVLEDVLNRLSEVLMQVNSKKLLHGILNIYLKHLKEFRRTLKRKEKYGGEIGELYRYSHVCINSEQSQKYYLHQLTINLLNHFINWELWNSLPCHALVSIIARKLTTYILNLLSSPLFLNYHILNLIGSKAVKSSMKLENYSKICFEENFDVTYSGNNQDEVDEIVKGKVSKDTKKQVHNTEQEEKEKMVIKKESPKKKKVTPIEIKPVIVNEPPAEVIVQDPVKIHEPKGSSSKVWNDSQDLISVSFGMDPLDSFLGDDKPPKTHWDGKVGKVDDPVESPTSATNMLLNEVRHITSMEGIRSSIKPISDATVTTLHNIKDLQESTVNNAMTKLGDFQDEAAGVVEGLLDFGRAGLRKGLRLTGLQDNIQNAKAVLSNNSRPKSKPTKLTRSDSTEKTNSSGDSVDSCWINPLQDTPNSDGQILLEKAKPAEDAEKPRDEVDFPVIPSISTESEESPDLEYEEPADLESTIAKLRCLLEQKSSESNLSTPALSPMPPDDFQKINQDPGTDMEDGVMPSFYKLCAKTATGVINKSINTIKTALPGNSSDHILNTEGWMFIENEETENDLLSRVHKLLNERKEFCKVDTAYEAIDSLESISNPVDIGSKVQFEDELDDFEVRLPITKAIFDIMCELLADTESLLLQESMIKAIMLSFGNSIEKNIVSKTENLVQHFCVHLFTIPDTTINNKLFVGMDIYINAILNSFPDYIKIIFSKENLQPALQLFISSLQNEKINQDIFLQVFEMLSMKLIEENIVQFSPPVSA